MSIAVRRALAKATGWGDHHWNIIGPSVLPTHVNVALDEVLTEEVGAGRRNRRCGSGTGRSRPW